MNSDRFYTSTVIFINILTYLFVNCVPIEKYVLDSTTFQGELNWDKEAFGDSAELPGWKEQSFSQKNGDVWRVHFVCDISSSNPNNWLRLPYIKREEANRLIIKLEYTIRECKKYPGEIRSCKETFQLLYIESDDQTKPPEFSESNYKYLKTIAPNSVSTAASSGLAPDTTTAANQPNNSDSDSGSGSIFRTEVDLPLRTTKKGVYLVFRDQGACVSLLSIKIFYTLCSSQISNLIVFPKTPTGSNLTDLVPRTGHCVPNSDSKFVPYAYCQTNGNWFITNDNGDNSNMCICRPGYYYSPSTSQCLACPQGRYKQEASNKEECQLCPDYSYSSGTASKFCKCLDGYYRVNNDMVNSSCLAYPPEPQNLTVYYLDQTIIKLRWNQIDTYDKSQLDYKLKCYKCIDNEGDIQSKRNSTEFVVSSQLKSHNSACLKKILCENYVQITPKKDEIKDNKVTLSSLDSSSQYFIELYGQHVHGLFKTKTVDIIVKTYDAISDLKVDNITAYQFVDMNQILVTWSDLTTKANAASSSSSSTFKLNNDFTSNPGQIDLYEIRYWPKDDYAKANIISIKAPAHNFTFKNSNPNVISQNLYVFQIRAKSSRHGGWGPYSLAVDSIRITNNLLKSSQYNFTYMSLQPSPDEQSIYSTVFTKDPAAALLLLSSNSNDRQNPNDVNRFEQLPQVSGYGKSITSNAIMVDRNESFTLYIVVAVTFSLCFIVVVLSTIIFLTRSGKVKFLSNYLLTKPVNSNSTSRSDCNSIDFTKRAAQMAYNQLGVCSGGSAGSSNSGVVVNVNSINTGSSSGGSSPIWPPTLTTKTYIDPHTYEDPGKLVQLFAKELSPSSIIIESVIGGGEFGDVCKGCLKLNPWSEAVVAIKTLKGAATEQNRCDFLTEASIMSQFNDANVVRLEGVVTLGHPLMIVTEFMENGSLDTFLHLNAKKLKLTQMIKILRDVASGMRYLSEMNYIHRDLAARNILVNKDLVCKVADFGLSREIEGDSFEYTTRGGKIPIRWTAPEACNFRKYSCASDVWSFGVLAWEVFSFGERPYWSWENKDVVRAVQEDYRLPPPDPCPDCLYRLMLRCWQVDRAKRPKFNEIVSILDEMFHYTDELRKPAKIREILPINQRAPTKIQLTSTKQFLSRLNLEHYLENFEQANLVNLSNLFQLDAKELALTVGICSPLDQKRILDELKRISDAFNNQSGFNTNNNQNSYTLFNTNKTNNNDQINMISSTHSNFFSNGSTTGLLQSHQHIEIHKQQNQQHQQQQQQQQQQSIFNLINRNNSIKTNSNINNDLLSFAMPPPLPMTQSQACSSLLSTSMCSNTNNIPLDTNTNGFLV